MTEIKAQMHTFVMAPRKRKKETGKEKKTKKKKGGRKKNKKIFNRSQLLFFSYGNPCRSETPSINTRRSDISQFRQDFWKKCWKVFFNQTMDKK